MATKKKKATKASKKASKKPGNGKSVAEPKGLTVGVQINMSEEIPSHYVNFAEIAHSIYEFVAIFGRIPTKATPAQAAAASETGVLEIEPVAQIMLPPELIPGLIRALQAQLEKFEEQHGKVRSKDS